MNALITLSGTGYDYLFMGTAEDAGNADESSLIASIGNAEYDDAGTTKTGAQFEIPVASLDQELKVASRSAKNGTWYDRTISFDSSTLEKVEAPKAEWKDGSYTSTATVTPLNNYPKEAYDIDVTVEIKDGKIADVKYAEEFTYDNGNISYLIWAMDGHHTDTSEKEGGSYKYVPGSKAQIIEAQGTDGIDAVSSATWASYAIQEAVEKSLVKAEKGEKDAETTPVVKPEKEIKTPEKEGEYTVEATAYGFDLLATEDVKLTYKDGKMVAVFTTTMSPSSYDYLYMGTDDEAYAAGKDAWLKPVAGVEYVNAKGQTKTGNQYEIPVDTLDDEVEFIVHARSSGNWFYRALKLDSATLEEVKAPGQDTPGQDTPGQDTPGQDTPGQDTPGQDTPGQDTSGQDKPDQDKPSQEKPNQDKPSDTDKDTDNKNDKDAVNTGDNTGSVFTWTVVSFLSAACFVALFLKKKYNRA